MTAPIIKPVSDGEHRPTWSILMPVCEPNLEHLQETVDSVLNSGIDIADAEVVIVDDATTRGSNELALENMTETLRSPSGNLRLSYVTPEV